MKRKLSISTLAFNGYDVDGIIKILKNNNIQNIDLAPLTIFKNWGIFFKNVYNLKSKLHRNGIKINAIQGVFFKVRTKLFFSSETELNKLYNHLYKLVIISKKLNAKKIIIGSSYLRSKKNIPKVLADEKFINFFSKFKKVLKKNKIYFCIETIPKQYNEDYLYEFDHTLDLIKKINSRYILINFDTSLFHFKNFKFNIFAKNLNKIKNIQVSSKYFKELYPISKNNKKFSKSLRNIKKLKIISLEMILNKPKELIIKRSILIFKKYFSI